MFYEKKCKRYAPCTGEVGRENRDSYTFVGAIMNGLTRKEAIKVAADYTAECIRITMEDEDDCWYGVNFEMAIPGLLKSIGK